MSAPSELVRARRYQQILADYSRMAAESSDTSTLLQLTAVQASRGTGIKHSKIMRYRPESGDLLVVAGVGWKPGVVGCATLGTDLGSASGQTLQTRQPLIVFDIEKEPEFRMPEVLREHGIVSLLNAPVSVDGVVWGVLEVDSETPRHFAQDDATFLLALGNVLGLALQYRTAAERGTRTAAEYATELATQNTMLRELEHRFKNDFQLIQSLLEMQRRRAANEQLRRDLRHVMDRVAAIGVAHDQLSISGAGGIVDLSDYLRALCGNLNLRKDGVKVETELTSVRMPHERVVPLGLIVNELVTNAIKHAYPGDSGGRVKVSFLLTQGGEGVLCVADDGVGMGPPRQGSSGTDLVTRLVQQVGGEIQQVTQEKGTGFCLRFPLVT